MFTVSSKSDGVSLVLDQSVEFVQVAGQQLTGLDPRL